MGKINTASNSSLSRSVSHPPLSTDGGHHWHQLPERLDGHLWREPFLRERLRKEERERKRYELYLIPPWLGFHTQHPPSLWLETPDQDVSSRDLKETEVRYSNKVEPPPPQRWGPGVQLPLFAISDAFFVSNCPFIVDDWWLPWAMVKPDTYG